MKIVLQNTLFFIRNNKLIFSVFFLCQLITCVTTLYIFSVFWSTQLDRIQRNEVYSTFSIFLKSTEASHQAISQLKNGTGYKKAIVYLDEYGLQAQVTYPPESDRFTVTGSYFSLSAFETGARQIIINHSTSTSSIGDLYWLNNYAYEIIAVNLDNGSYNEVPFYSLPDPAEINLITYTLNTIPTQQEKEQTKDWLSNLFPDSTVVVPDDINIVILTSGFLEYFVMICVLLLALLNTSYLYQYILHRRRKQFIVMRLVGCNKSQAILIFLSEIVVISSVVFLISCILISLAIAPCFSIINGGIKYALGITEYLWLYPIFLGFVIFVFYRIVKKFTQANFSSLIRGK